MEIRVADRTVTLYTAPGCPDRTPVVFLLTGDERGEAVWEETRKRTGRPFSLAVIPVEDWNRDLSPWTNPRIFKGGEDFGGGADDMLEELETRIVPAVRAALGPAAGEDLLAGYSLAGLCAVYALYRTAAFSGVVSASGSLWFPGFSRFAAEHEFAGTPRRVYLSLGDRESQTKNPVMAQVGECTTAFGDLLRDRGVESVFEWNPGNHFQDAELRLAKGIAWLVEKT